MAIGRYHDAGIFDTMRAALNVLVVALDRIGSFGEAAVIAGFAESPLSSAAVSEIVEVMGHLRSELGDTTCGSLVARGRAMEPATAVRYALGEIDRMRATL